MNVWSENMSPTKNTARLAGLLFLLAAVTGGFRFADFTVELSIIQYRSSPKEVKEDVLFSLRRGCRAKLELL